MNNLQIEFLLDGTGIIYNELIHLDALLAFVSLSYQQERIGIKSDEIPVEFELPLDRWYIKNYWGWYASVLFPEYDNETLQYFRRKLNEDRIEYTKGQINFQGGFFKSKNNPERLILTSKIIAYCRGDKEKINNLLNKIKYLGKRRNVGKGKVVNINIREIENNYSMVKNGKAQRYLPKKNGLRLVRCRPPYWHRIDRINCCEIGDKYEI